MSDKNTYGKRQQPQNTQNTRRRVTRCSARQRDIDNAIADSTKPVTVQVGEKIDLTKLEITLEDREKTTLTKVAEFSYVIGGSPTLPTLRSRSRQRAENMSRYNDPPRYYNPRDRDYRDNCYTPPSQQFERRQVAKKSTAQQAQAHQYGHKRPPGPDFHQGSYKRSRVSHGDDYRYNRGMSPPEYRNGVDTWRQRGPPPPQGRPHRGRGRPPKYPRHDFSQDDWGENDFPSRSRSSEPKRTEESSRPKRTEESTRSQSQETPPSRGRGRPPKSSNQDSSEKKSTSNGQTDPQAGKSAVDKGSTQPSKPAVVKGGSQPSKPAVVKGGSQASKPAVAKGGPQSAKSAVAKSSPQPAKSAVAKGSPQPAKTAVAKDSPQPAKSTVAKSSPQPVKATVAKDSAQPAKSTVAKSSPQSEKAAVAKDSPQPTKSTGAKSSPQPAKTAVAKDSSQPTNSTVAKSSPQPAKTAVAKDSPQPAKSTVAKSSQQPAKSAVAKDISQPTKSTVAKDGPQPAKTSVAKDSPQTAKSVSEKVTTNSPKPNQVKPVSKAVVNNSISSNASPQSKKTSTLVNHDKSKQVQSSIKVKPNARKSTYSPGKIRPSDDQALEPDADVEWKVLSEAGSDSEDARQSRPSKAKFPDGRVSALDNALRIEKMRKEEEARLKAAEAAAQTNTSSGTETNASSATSKAATDTSDGDVQKTNSAPIRMAARKSLPNLARKAMPSFINKATTVVPPSASTAQTDTLEIPKDNGKQGMARKSAPKSSNQKGSASPSENEDQSKEKSTIEKDQVDKPMNGPTSDPTFKPFGPRITGSARKLAPVSSNALAKKLTLNTSAGSVAPPLDQKGETSSQSARTVPRKDTARKTAPPSSNAPKPISVVTAKVHSTSTPSEESSSPAPDQQGKAESNSSQSARTVPIKQLHPPKNSGGTLQRLPNAQVMPTARKTAPSSSEQQKKAPKVRIPVQPKSVDSAPSEQPKKSPEVRMPIQPKNLDSINTALSDGPKDKAKGLKTFNLSVFKSDKLKNILGKVSAKREEAKNSSLINNVMTAPDVVKLAVDKKELDMKENLLKESIIDETLTKVKQMPLEVTKFEVTKEKLRGANTEEDQKNVKNEVKNEVKSELSTTKQETKDTIILNVPQIQKSVETTDLKGTKEESKVDGVEETDAAKLEVKPEMCANQANAETDLAKGVSTAKPKAESVTQQVQEKKTTVQFVVGAKSLLPKPSVASAPGQMVEKPTINNASTKTNVNASLETAKSTVKEAKAGVVVEKRKNEKADETLSKVAERSSKDSDKVSDKVSEPSVKVDSLQAETESKLEVEKVTGSGKVLDNDAVTAKPGGTTADGNAASSSSASSKLQTESTKPLERTDGNNVAPKAMSPWELYKNRNNKSGEASPGPTGSASTAEKKAKEESTTGGGENLSGSKDASDSGSSAEVTTSAVEQLRQKSVPAQKDSNSTAKLPSTSLTKTVVSRSSPARKSGESYSSDDALLLNSSTNDSADEPMEIDGDSEMDDYLLADDVPSKEEKASTEGDKKELPMDTAEKSKTKGDASKTIESDASSKPEPAFASNEQASKPTSLTVPDAALQKQDESTPNASESNANAAQDSSITETNDVSEGSNQQQPQPDESKTKAIADSFKDAAIQNSQPGQAVVTKEKETDTSSKISVKDSDIASAKVGSEEVPEAAVPSGVSEQKEKASTEESAMKEKASVESSAPEPPTPANNQNTSTSETTKVAASASLPADSSEKTSEGSAAKADQKSVQATPSISQAKLAEAGQKKVEGESVEQTLSSVSSDKLVEQKPSDKPSEEKTVEKKDGTQTVTPVSGKVTPSVTAEEQSKSSRSAIPSATNDSGAENDLDIIELSSDEDNKANSSASGKTKIKKKKVKPKAGSEQADGSSKPATGKRSASPQQLEAKAKKKAKLGEAKEKIDLSNLSKPELFTKLIEMKMKQHLKKYMDMAAEAKALKEQLAASETSRQKWQMESTRLQIKVHELTEQNDILKNKHKTVPSRVVVATGTQYDRVDVLQAQQMLAGISSATAAVTSAAKQSLAVAPSPSTLQMRVTAQQQLSHPAVNRSQPTVASSHQQQRTVASDVSRPNPMLARPGASIASPMRPTGPQTVNAMAGSSPAGAAAKAPVAPNKQLNNPYGHHRHQQQPQSQPLNLQSPACSTSAPRPAATSPLTSSVGGGFQASASTASNKPAKITMPKSATSSKKRLLDDFQRNNKTVNSLVSKSNALIRPKVTRYQGKRPVKTKCNLCMPTVTSRVTSTKANNSRKEIQHKEAIQKDTSEVAPCENNPKGKPGSSLESCNKGEPLISNKEPEPKKVGRVVPVCITTVSDIVQQAAIESGIDGLEEGTSDLVEEEHSKTPEISPVIAVDARKDFTEQSLSVSPDGLNISTLTEPSKSDKSMEKASIELCVLGDSQTQSSAQSADSQSAMKAASESTMQASGQVAESAEMTKHGGSILHTCGKIIKEQNDANVTKSADVAKSVSIETTLDPPTTPPSESSDCSSNTSDDSWSPSPVLLAEDEASSSSSSSSSHSVEEVDKRTSVPESPTSCSPNEPVEESNSSPQIEPMSDRGIPTTDVSMSKPSGASVDESSSVMSHSKARVDEKTSEDGTPVKNRPNVAVEENYSIVSSAKYSDISMDECSSVDSPSDLVIDEGQKSQISPIDLEMVVEEECGYITAREERTSKARASVNKSCAVSGEVSSSTTNLGKSQLENGSSEARGPVEKSSHLSVEESSVPVPVEESFLPVPVSTFANVSSEKSSSSKTTAAQSPQMLPGNAASTSTVCESSGPVVEHTCRAPRIQSWSLSMVKRTTRALSSKSPHGVVAKNPLAESSDQSRPGSSTLLKVSSDAKKRQKMRVVQLASSGSSRLLPKVSEAMSLAMLVRSFRESGKNTTSPGKSQKVRPTAPTAKPGDVRAKSSAAKRPAPAPAASAAAAAAPNSSDVEFIDLTDEDDHNRAAAAANKGRVQPLNPVRTPQGGQVRGPPQQVGPKTPPAAHSRTTPPRASMPSAAASRQQQVAANIVRGTVATSKPGQVQQQQSATSRLAEFTQQQQQQAQQRAQQQGQQVQILQTVQRGQIPAAAQQQQRQIVQQQPQRSIATQQVSPNVVVTQARVPPMQQARTVTLPAAGGTQLVSLPGNATSTLSARGVAPILQQGGQPQQVQLQQVLQPGAQIIQTPQGQVVMTPAMSSGVATVLTTQPIQAGAVQYQIVNSQGVGNTATVQQMLQIQQQQQQQQATARTAQVIGTRFSAPAGASPNVQQGGHVIHHRGTAPRAPAPGHSPRMTRAPAPRVQQHQQPPPYPQQQRRPSFSEPGTVHAIPAPATTATNNVGQTEVQKQIANIQAQIAQFEAMAHNAQQAIQKLQEEDKPYESRRIGLMKQLQMGNHGTYKTQELHMQFRHIQSEQTRIQTENKTKVGQLQQYQHSKYQLQQNLQQLQRQRQQALQQGQQPQQTVRQHIAQASRPPATVPSTAIVPSNPRRHPAPLPSVQNSNTTVMSNAAPPPKPTLSISKVNQGIVLSWNMSIDNHLHATIDFYNLYAYQETEAAPNTSLWKKIGEVKALPLPMACTLTQFQPGSMYHFAVCAIDIYHRTGPFSDPSSINLPAI